MTVQIIRREVIHTHSKTSFMHKTARMPDGTLVEKAALSHPGSVGLVPLTADGRLVLVRQYRLPLEDFLLEIPAGGLEPGETPEVCARRELQEEAGYYPASLQPLTGVYLSPGTSDEYMHLFLAQALQPSPRPGDPDELIQVAHVPLADAAQMIESGEIRDAKTISGLYQAMRLLQAGS
ncbi:MAG: NUDIX hydrolase [Anaerolineales bacterium]